MTKTTKGNLIVILKACVAMTLFAIALINYDELRSVDIETLVYGIDNIYYAIGIVFGIYIVKSLVFVLPASLIYVAVGAVFSSYIAIPVNMIGIILEVTITFLLGFFLGGENVKRILNKNKGGRKLLEMDYHNKRSLIFFVRFIPAFPIDFVSLFFGATRSNFPKYLLLSILGLAPRVIAFTFLGNALFEWFPDDIIILLIIIGIPIGVVIYLVKKLVLENREKKKQEIKSKQENKKEK